VCQADPSDETLPERTVLRALRNALDERLALSDIKGTGVVLCQLDTAPSATAADGNMAPVLTSLSQPLLSEAFFPMRTLHGATQVYVLDADALARSFAARVLHLTPPSAAHLVSWSTPQQQEAARFAQAWIGSLTTADPGRPMLGRHMEGTRQHEVARAAGTFDGSFFMDGSPDASVVSRTLFPAGTAWASEDTVASLVGGTNLSPPLSASLTASFSVSAPIGRTPSPFPVPPLAPVPSHAAIAALSLETEMQSLLRVFLPPAPPYPVSVPAPLANADQNERLDGVSDAFTLSEQLAAAHLRSKDARAKHFWDEKSAALRSHAAVLWPVFSPEFLGEGFYPAYPAGTATGTAEDAIHGAIVTKHGVIPRLAPCWRSWCPYLFPARRGVHRVLLCHGTSIGLARLLARDGFRRPVCRLKANCKTGHCECQMEGFGVYFAERTKADGFAIRRAERVGCRLDVLVDLGCMKVATPDPCPCGCGKLYVDHYGAFYSRDGFDSLYVRDDSLPATRFMEWCVPDPGRCEIVNVSEVTAGIRE
jgi:hypothetical protein